MTDRKLFDGRGATDSGPVSRNELESLRTRRGDPAPVLEYNFGEGTKPKLRKLDLLRDARARHVESRLRGIDGHIENEFACAVVSGRTKFDFERSR